MNEVAKVIPLHGTGSGRPRPDRKAADHKRSDQKRSHQNGDDRSNADASRSRHPSSFAEPTQLIPPTGTASDITASPASADPSQVDAVKAKIVEQIAGTAEFLRRRLAGDYTVDEFGYDPHFVPEGETRTNAELTGREKSAQSHRGRAVRALIPILRLNVGLPSVEAGG